MSKLSVQVESEVIERLEVRPQSLKDLEKKLQRNYYTVRKAVRSLEDQGRVKPYNNDRRNTLFTLAGDNTPNSIIPRVRTSKSYAKMDQLITLRGVKTRALSAVEDLPRQVTRILVCAERLSKGSADPINTLETIKSELEDNLSVLRDVVMIHEQILQESRVWSPESLKRFVHDTEYDADEVQEAYEYYYATEEES